MNDILPTLKQDIKTLTPAQKANAKRGFDIYLQQQGTPPAQIQAAEQQFGFQGRMTIS
ncbi:MAG: hypothetical protein WBE34_08370 [Candidatus Nitrosopolaris sp.]